MRNLSSGALLSVTLGVVAPILVQARAQSDWTAADRALGRSGAEQPGGVHKYSFPRGDLTVTLGSTQLRPALALGTWLAFKRATNGKAMVMGDLVLTEAEVAPVIAALQRGGIGQTAVHNHLIGETPRLVYMHVMGTGDESKLAATLHDALASTHTPLAPPPQITPLRLTLDTVAVAAALGVSGKGNGGVYQVSVPRPEVIRALGASGIKVTALHSHLLMDQPHILFMHFWGDDDALKLARGLRAALDATAMAPGKAR